MENEGTEKKCLTTWKHEWKKALNEKENLLKKISETVGQPSGSIGYELA